MRSPLQRSVPGPLLRRNLTGAAGGNGPVGRLVLATVALGRVEDGYRWIDLFAPFTAGRSPASPARA